MKIVTQPEVANAVEAYQEYFNRRKAYVASVKEFMAALDAERDQLLPKLKQVNDGKAFVIPGDDGSYRVVEFKDKQGRLNPEAMADTLRSIRRKPQRFPDEVVPLVRELNEDEIELLPK